MTDDTLETPQLFTWIKITLDFSIDVVKDLGVCNDLVSLVLIEGYKESDVVGCFWVVWMLALDDLCFTLARNRCLSSCASRRYVRLMSSSGTMFFPNAWYPVDSPSEGGRSSMSWIGERRGDLMISIGFGVSPSTGSMRRLR